MMAWMSGGLVAMVSMTSAQSRRILPTTVQPGSALTAASKFRPMLLTSS